MSVDLFFRKAARDDLAAVISATMFLSRLPLKPIAERLWLDVVDVDFAKSSRYFGIAALIIAIPSALAMWLAGFLGASPLLSSVIATIALVITTGALHEDALADVADGFGGGSGVDKKLYIMRDSRIGSYGASGLILSFAMHIALLTQLTELSGVIGAAITIVAANIASTSLIVWPWATLPPARSKGGLSASHGIPNRDIASQAMMIGLPISFALLWMAIGLFQALVALAIGWAVMMLFSAFCLRQIGGHTGDTLGATKKICELGLLLALIVAT